MKATPILPFRASHRALAAALVAALSGLPAFASSVPAAATDAGRAVAATGAIVGRVQNVVTGQYLTSARVMVVGTDRVAFTDESGTFRLAAVPPGAVRLQVFFTGLDTGELTVPVSAGQTAEATIELSNRAKYGERDGTVKLDSYVVSTAREVDGDTIAVNEQRFAPNIKNVISADALGDVTDGNVGEFLKFLPGITAEYDGESGSSVASVAVRGFPTSMAVVSGDGMQMANTGNPQGSSRVFQFTQSSMNNIARVEVTKVPTPSTPADSMAGSINMVSKSAFERKSAQLRYSFSLSGNDPFLDLGKTPHTSDRKIYKVRPSGGFDYTLPISKNLGLVVTAQSTNRFMWHRVGIKTYNSGGTGTGASQAQPFLQQYQLQGSPRTNERTTLGLRVDWRITPSGVLSFGLEAGRFLSDRSAAATTLNAGTNATPTPATGVRMSYGPDFTIGATGRGAVTLMSESASVVQLLNSRSSQLRYRFDNGDWRVVSGLGLSRSQGGYQDTRHGRFRMLGISLRTPVRVSFLEVREDRPQTIQIFDNANNPVDYFNLNNYQLTTANSTPRYIQDSLATAKLDVRKSLRALPFPAAVQVGGTQRMQTRDVRRETITWTYNGPDGNPATVDGPAPYAMTNYVNENDGFGFRRMPWVSVYKAWEAYQANPRLWAPTPAQIVAQELFRVNNSERLQEDVGALYTELELRLLRNRLRVLTGVRYEQTKTKGEGVLYDPTAVWRRDPDGSFAHNAAGARVRKPEAGAAGSMDELGLTRTERGYRAQRTYDGYYPSLHLSYNLRENLVARAAVARTYGRPDFTNIVPNSTIDEADLEGAVINPSLVPGRITIRNTGLRPWTANNFDLSLEYYTEQGGVLGGGVFMKEIDDFFGSVVRVATPEDLRELGLDPDYVGWELSTQFNLPGTARVRGVEFSVQQDLSPLGRWGRPFQVFANATKLELDGSQQAEFEGFIPESANWGVRARFKRGSLMLKWNYRGEQKGVPVAGVGGFDYGRARTTVDVNAEAPVWRTLTLFFAIQNLTNIATVRERYGSLTPDYARRYHITRYGAQLNLGVKGTF